MLRAGAVAFDPYVSGFFAARLGAARVHAIEHGPIIDAAQPVALANGIDNVVFHRVHIDVDVTAG